MSEAHYQVLLLVLQRSCIYKAPIISLAGEFDLVGHMGASMLWLSRGPLHSASSREAFHETCTCCNRAIALSLILQLPRDAQTRVQQERITGSGMKM